MAYFEQSGEYRPLFWARGHPIYANSLVLGLHVAAFVATALCMATLSTPQVEYALCFDSPSIFHGEIWRLASYVIFFPSLFFIFALGFLYFAGREVERYVGWKVYLTLYAALVLLPSALLCGAVGFWPQTYQGGWESIFGVFVAFATLYPGIMFSIWFVNLTAKNWALILLAVGSLMDLSYHSWAGLYFLWMDAAVGYLGMRYIGAGRGLDWLTDWLDEQRARKLSKQRNFKIVKERKASESIDVILEKISRHGVTSLSAEERAVLEKARTNLIKRDQI